MNFYPTDKVRFQGKIGFSFTLIIKFNLSNIFVNMTKDFPILNKKNKYIGLMNPQNDFFLKQIY